MHGQGTYSFSNGDEYIGNFQNGLRNGQGVYVKISGEKLTGIWKNNQFINEDNDKGFNCLSGDCLNGIDVVFTALPNGEAQDIAKRRYGV